MLAMPIDGGGYVLDTDASNYSMGCVLANAGRRAKSHWLCKQGLYRGGAWILYNAKGTGCRNIWPETLSTFLAQVPFCIAYGPCSAH